MASGALFNPRTLLLVTPLISTTCSLWYSHDQDRFLGLITQLDKKKADAILPAYIRSFFRRGTAEVVGLIAATVCSSLASIWLYRPELETRGSLHLYAWTAALAVGHLAWVPAVAWKLKALVDETAAAEGTTNVGMMERWLRVNFVRMLTSDLGAWLCALAAVSTTLSV
ncbi:hypothetical protein AK830_g2520 [Neonectria ditissima]|uniref:Integral membrane protein n=1 Tax=Neonectria ditissima TaxID=78410 RepID=A0A0P7BV75_9HYPO|nr:hypothetical protein AK830_g2520 [Neonectria ditissima]